MMIRKPKLNGLIVIVTVIASVAMIVKGIMYQPTKQAHNRKADEIRANCKYEKEKSKKIDEDRQRVGTPEYTEEIAREKLGMVKNGELVFIDMDMDTSEQE